MKRTLFGWKTRKNEAGQFVAIITKSITRDTPNADGQYADTTRIVEVPCRTRAIAKNHAQKWVRFMKANPTWVAA